MSAALAIWSVRVEPKKKLTVVPQSDLHITGAALDATLADEKARSSVKLTYLSPLIPHPDEDENSDEELPTLSTTSAVLCSLTPGLVCPPSSLHVNSSY